MRSLVFEDSTWATSEQLKHTLSCFWSRRLSQKDRVIYKFDDHYVYIFAIGSHYDQQG